LEAFLADAGDHHWIDTVGVREGDGGRRDGDEERERPGAAGGGATGHERRGGRCRYIG
jgi:hypothetical protein